MEKNTLENIPTPALVLNYDIMEKNMRYMADFIERTKVNLRHHTKTAKIPLIAHLQMKIVGDSAKGIAVAKVGEAEIYAQCGFDDILIANQVIDPHHIERLVLLNKYTLTRCVVDSQKNVVDLNEAAKKYKINLEVLIDIDLGMGRTGVKPRDPALELANFIKEQSNLNLVGLQGYEGHLTPQTDNEIRKQQTEECMKELVATRDLLNRNGFNIDYLTASGSGTFMFSPQVEGITEIQPGTYVFSDDHLHRVVPEFEPAVSILTTVQNNTAKRLYTLDAGTKTFPTGDGKPIFKDYPRCRFRVITEEHSQIKAGPNDEFQLGQKIELIPAHICITINLHDFIHVIKAGEYIGKWPILARGKNY
ncbi:MAG: putative Alanine racemase [Promethearchaeota archaeon]|nr:MAG: putative Alanine racemase [Candidatus Lokiarchaeota archaeon]